MKVFLCTLNFVELNHHMGPSLLVKLLEGMHLKSQCLHYSQSVAGNCPQTVFVQVADYFLAALE